MAGDVAGELAGLRTAVDRLTQGLQLMLETQATQTEMLRAVLEAASSPAPADRELSDLLARIAATLQAQGGSLQAILKTLTSLPADVGTAVAASVRDGLAGV